MAGVKFRRNVTITTTHMHVCVHTTRTIKPPHTSVRDWEYNGEQCGKAPNIFLLPMCVDGHTYLHTCALTTYVHISIHTKQ